MSSKNSKEEWVESDITKKDNDEKMAAIYKLGKQPKFKKEQK